MTLARKVGILGERYRLVSLVDVRERRLFSRKFCYEHPREEGPCTRHDWVFRSLFCWAVLLHVWQSFLLTTGRARSRGSDPAPNPRLHPMGSNRKHLRSTRGQTIRFAWRCTSSSTALALIGFASIPFWIYDSGMFLFEGTLLDISCFFTEGYGMVFPLVVAPALALATLAGELIILRLNRPHDPVAARTSSAD